jgi:putative mRNA 3-end processing factor
MKIKFLGGAQEIGRNAIAIKSGEACLLLDYGVLLNEGPGFPGHIAPREVSAIIATHAHLDHIGAIPIFHVRGHTPVYGTDVTFNLIRLLITDFLHLASYYLPYEYLDLDSMLHCSRSLTYGEARTVGSLSFKLLDAGHIPGSAQVLIQSEKSNLLYTSDINTVRTRLLKEATLTDVPLDCLIIESTYANEDHEDRKETEKRFVKEVTEVIEDGGTVLVPAFSVGRAQEVLCILRAHHFPYPITLDGMARKASEILMQHSHFLRDSVLFLEALHNAYWVRGKRDRRRRLREKGVIISPAGMLKGGAAVFYLERLAKNPENAIFLVGYQISGTPGHQLLSEKKFLIKGEVREVKARVERFDFSSHAGRSGLIKFARMVKGNPTVFTIHGADNNCNILAEIVREEVGLKALSPKPGKVFHIGG